MFALIKGAGDLASGIALRLHHAGFFIAMTEIAAPLSVRRAVSFSQAVYEGRFRVEDIEAVLVDDEEGMKAAWYSSQAPLPGQIAVFVDPEACMVKRLRPDAIVDAIMAKKNTGTAITDAPAVIGIGPGFNAGKDCHAVIETQRGHTLGRVIMEGSALPNTGVPGEIAGFSTERLLRCPSDGVFEALANIGDRVNAGDLVARVAGEAFPGGAAFPLRAGMKAGDIDPRCERSHCFTVSDKALAIGGGVLEAILHYSGGMPTGTP